MEENSKLNCPIVENCRYRINYIQIGGNVNGLNESLCRDNYLECSTYQNFKSNPRHNKMTLFEKSYGGKR